MKIIDIDINSEYLKDSSLLTGFADKLYLCESTSDCEELVSMSLTNKTHLTIQGGLTGLCGGAVPRGGIIANLSSMSSILGMRSEKDEFILICEAGVTLETINNFLSTKRINTALWSEESKSVYKSFVNEDSMFTNDPTETEATLGGMVSCEASGANSFKYGSIREYVEGLTVVTGRKTLHIKRGEYKYSDLSSLLGDSNELPVFEKNQDIKDVSGIFYKEDMDLIDLFIGSEGIFGVITEIEIRLIKKPTTVMGLQLFIKDNSKLTELIDWLRGGTITDSECITAIEYFDEESLKVLESYKSISTKLKKIGDIPNDAVGSIYLEFHFHSADIEDLLNEVVVNMSKYGVSDQNQWVALDDEDYQKLKDFRHALPEAINNKISLNQLQSKEIHKVGTDMAVRDEHLSKVLDMYRDDLKLHKLEGVIFGHIGDNHLHVNIIPSNKQEYDLGLQVVSKWGEEVIKMGGTISAEHGVGKIKKHLFAKISSDNDIISIMRLKNILDPVGIFNVGTIID